MIKTLPTVEELFAAGAHYGHVKERSHPKAKLQTYSIINKVLIIDLEKTHEQIQRAVDFVSAQAKKNKVFLLVGTKRQAKEIVEKVGKQYTIPYLSTKWLGGTLTNFPTIKANLKRLEEYETEATSKDFSLQTKRYQAGIKQKINKLHKALDGMKDLQGLPDILIVVDIHKENIAVEEARRLELPVIGILDTNSDPNSVDYPIMINDDSQAAVTMVITLLAETIAEGKKAAPAKEEASKEKI